MSVKKNKKEQFLMYRGNPLVRCENTLYYGNMFDRHVIMMQILDSKMIDDLEVATKVSVQLILTDENVKAKDKIVRRTEKAGLYPAMDVASIWLERANSQKL